MKKSVTTLTLLTACNLTYAMGGGLEDKIADGASWVVLILLPIAGIYLFWQAHIYPEKVAERNHHPQLNAIKSLCILSLFFGGLLWPFALVWANYKYSNVAFPDEETEEKRKHILDAIDEKIEHSEIVKTVPPEIEKSASEVSEAPQTPSTENVPKHN